MSKVPLTNQIQAILGSMLSEVVVHARGVDPSVTTMEVLHMYSTSDHYQKLYRELLEVIGNAIAEQSTFLNDINIEIQDAINKVEEL
ncbi:MAG: hypothetical protein EPO02_13450 [Nitrospirae bacterium]|nr:MAG: hypothetical protein EPO02_13450 [Nitrospirota bacterium]